MRLSGLSGSRFDERAEPAPFANPPPRLTRVRERSGARTGFSAALPM